MEDFSSQFHKHQKKLHAKPRERLLTPRQRCTSRLTGLFPLVVTNQESHAKVKSCQEETCARLSRKRGASLVPQTTGRTGQAGEKGGRSSVLARNRCFQLRRWHCACEQRRILLLCCDNLASSMSFALGGPSHRQSGSSVPRDRRCFQLRCWRCACEQRRILLHCRDNLATSRVLSPAVQAAGRKAHRFLEIETPPVRAQTDAILDQLQQEILVARCVVHPVSRVLHCHLGRLPRSGLRSVLYLGVRRWQRGAWIQRQRRLRRLETGRKGCLRNTKL